MRRIRKIAANDAGDPGRVLRPLLKLMHHLLVGGYFMLKKRWLNVFSLFPIGVLLTCLIACGGGGGGNGGSGGSGGGGGGGNTPINPTIVENLDEMVARKGRMASASWGPSNMENSSNSYIWQPESLMYFDSITGREVWRLTTTNDQDNFYHNDIGWSHWSADGKWLAFASTRNTAAFTKTTDRNWYLVKTDGSNLMPVIGGSARGYSGEHEYFHWSPQIPDVYYDTGERGNALALNAYDVYKNSASEAGVTRWFLFTTNAGSGNSRAKKLSKTISGDGKKVLLRDAYVSSGPHYLYPCTVYPDASAKCDDLDGYSIDRGQGPGWDNMPSSYTREHSGGLFLSGNDSMGYYWYLLPSGTSAWWRMPVAGTAPDGGPLYTPPGTSGEVIIESSESPPYPPWPDFSPWAHVTPDWWGNRVVYTASDDYHPGIAHDNAITHGHDSWGYINDYGTQHTDWHGFTDYTVVSYQPFKTPNDGLGQRITSQRYNDTTLRDITTVCFTHLRYNGGTDYSTLPRPFISPDGTKVGWSSEFLNASPNKNDIFWAVIRYPKPPVNVSAQKNGTDVRLTWERPSYTTRGWPNEASDPPPKSKEIKGYHVWSSNDGQTGWTEQTTNAVSTEYLDINQPNNTTRYYAVTSEEHSRLESRNLSAIRKVTLDAAGNLTDSQHAAEGKTAFWTTRPSAPSPSDFVIQPGGNYLLTWTEPADPKVRYYNIYYSATGSPPIDQQHRIASLPVGTTKFLDWLADKSRPGYYKVTAVDRQGNE